MIKTFQIFESSTDVVRLPNGEYVYETHPDAIPFLYYIYDLYVGEPREQHGDIVYKISSNSDPIIPILKVREDCTHSGRIWLDHKIIAIWGEADKRDFDFLINDLEDELNVQIWDQGFQIEIEKIDINGKWTCSHPDYEKFETKEIKRNEYSYCKFIPIEEYSGKKNIKHKPKLTLQQRQLMYAENCDNIILNNNGDKISFKNSSFPFYYYNGELWIGEFNKSHSSIHMNDNIKSIDLKRDMMEKSYYRGRIYVENEIISFWDYPPKSKFDDIIYDLENETELKIWNNGYVLEIIKEHVGRWKYSYEDYEKIEVPEIKIDNQEYVKFIPIETVSGRKNISYKPKFTLQQRQLMYAENMITHFKLFEWLSQFKHGERPVKLDIGYHITPLMNVQEIQKNGLLPKEPLRKLEEPTAIYLSKSVEGVIELSRQLYQYRINHSIGQGVRHYKTDWIILKVNIQELELFEDPSAITEEGMYTLNPISPDRISIYDTIDYEIIKNGINWHIFWNWWFWETTDKKPDFVKKLKSPRDTRTIK